MNKQYKPVRDVWEFEQYLASKPNVWVNRAYDLRYSAEALHLYDNEVLQRVFKEKKPTRLPPFWIHSVLRMLLGFSLENLIKAILLQDPDRLKKVFGRDGNLSWGKDGHDLLKLFQEAALTIDPQEQKYLKLWQLCALWAGRYPLPANEHDFPRQRKALPTREALLRRTQKRIEAAMKNGDPSLVVEIHDLLHTGAGNEEIDIFRNVFDKCLALLPQAEATL